ncbi:GMC oxidoreductase [Azospirillum sp. sgz301742]
MLFGAHRRAPCGHCADGGLTARRRRGWECEVFDAPGLFVPSSAVFSTSGHANPTLTIVALAEINFQDRHSEASIPSTSPNCHASVNVLRMVASRSETEKGFTRKP